MYLFRRAATNAALKKKTHIIKHPKKVKKRKKCETKDTQFLNGCVGISLRLGERHLLDPRPSRTGCSSRCKHATHLKEGLSCSGHGRSDEWISEDIYKRFTETDSRPLTPEHYSKRSISLHRSSSVGMEKMRKCVTPEPDTKQCQFHSRRVLILDLRRVKSVDAITRQNSMNTGDSVDSTYGDYDNDNISSINRDSASMFPHSTPRNFSMSRSTSPKGTRQKGRINRLKERSGSPLAYERSSSPKILEGLTLPPLHQSVLTLLGQKSGAKGSPRNHVIHELGSAFESANNQKAKLRRHGRKKKTKDDEKEAGDKEGEKTETGEALDGDGDDDELQETQLNTQHQDEGEEEEAHELTKPLQKAPSCVTQMKSLRDVLDETLCKDRWSLKEMESITEEIDKLSLGLRKYQTEFQTKSISVSEDSWLMFPRTCTHTTATFGIPSNSKLFKGLLPIEYLRDYVSITEPRLHLYNLIYQRYRILENPTGTTITTKSLQRALSEVLGRSFEDQEMEQLMNIYLQLEEHCCLDPKTFAGICAFSERVFGRYELEKRLQCIVCMDQKNAHKERCHLKRKSALENMDLFYLSNKIKFGETNERMANLIEALVSSEE